MEKQLIAEMRFSYSDELVVRIDYGAGDDPGKYSVVEYPADEEVVDAAVREEIRARATTPEALVQAGVAVHTPPLDQVEGVREGEAAGPVVPLDEDVVGRRAGLRVEVARGDDRPVGQSTYPPEGERCRKRDEQTQTRCNDRKPRAAPK